ncbi:N-acyl-phosphatidylethanolamine-hydrolyzing phospholipase D isoform X2 [Tetranychus urticae]|nr:N-acyl-phosphatidylethanolamine-hydrolyzing phospholipase D isoform X2 [Tetranychus urticae]
MATLTRMMVILTWITIESFLAFGQADHSRLIKPGDWSRHDNSLISNLNSFSSQLGLVGRVISPLKPSLDSNPIVLLSDSDCENESTRNYDESSSLLNILSTLQKRSQGNLFASSQSNPIFVNLISPSDKVNSNIPSNIRNMAVSRKSTRSIPDECPNSVTKNTIEKQVTKSVRVDGRYKNPWDTWNENAFRVTSLMRFGFSRDNSNVPNQKELDKLLPIEKPVFQDENSNNNGVRITWIGHSTIVAQFDNFNVITDPIFSSRASPSQFFGPKRYRNPPCTINDLPATLNAVVISHNHYDHLDVASVTSLNERYGTSLSWYVPMGLKSWFNSIGIKHAVEMDWWDEICYNGSITIAFTPAQHWSKRGISDDFLSLWGSWTFVGPTQRFFFTGDTGYCPAFKEIGAVYGPFTVAAIPIGAYEPRWFMKPQHVDPEEAVLIHQDLKARASVAIHWGTFALANEFFLDPPLKLKSTLEKLNLSGSEFITLKHGESKVFPLDPKEAEQASNRFPLSMIAYLQVQANSVFNSTFINTFLNYVTNFLS